MNSREGEVLKDEVRIGEILQETVDDRLDSLAVGALEVSELYEFEVFPRGSAAGSGGTLRQDAPCVGVRMVSEGQDIGRDEVLAVRRDVEDQRGDLLRSGFLRYVDGDLADARCGRVLDGLYLPDTVCVVSPGRF